MAAVNAFHPARAEGDFAANALAVQPKITAEALLNVSDKDKQSLIDIYELLHRLFVRNRNQHRRNHWFKSLQSFRKQLGMLLEEMGVDTGKKYAQFKATRAEKITTRLQHLDDKCIHNWYLHFTQLLASGPFAILGLVLMACTARVCRVTGITTLYEEIASEDMRMALAMIDEGQAEEELGSLLGGGEEGEDWGEVVEREE